MKIAQRVQPLIQQVPVTRSQTIGKLPAEAFVPRGAGVPSPDWEHGTELKLENPVVEDGLLVVRNQVEFVETQPRSLVASSLLSGLGFAVGAWASGALGGGPGSCWTLGLGTGCALVAGAMVAAQDKVDLVEKSEPVYRRELLGYRPQVVKEVYWDDQPGQLYRYQPQIGLTQVGTVARQQLQHRAPSEAVLGSLALAAGLATGWWL